MVFAIRCTQTHRFHYLEADQGAKTCVCPQCGGEHEAEPTSFEMPPGFRTPAPFKLVYSMQHGRRLKSREDYRQANKDMNLVDAGDYKPELKDTSFAPDTGKISSRVD